MRVTYRSLLGLTALLLTISLACTPAMAAPEAQLRTPPIIENPKSTLLDTEGAGKLYQIGEHLVCVMEGSPEEMGFQHGRLLAKKIKHVLTEGYVKKSLWERGYTYEYVMQQSERMEKFFPPEYVTEMKGIVKGLRAAGIEDLNYEDVRLGVTEAEILHFEPNSPPECTNFACWGKWTTDGRLLHGRNLDWDIQGGAQDDAVTFIWRPTGKHPFMMVGWAGAIGSVSGMSATGLTVGEMTLRTPNVTFDGMPMLLMLRRVLEQDTLEQAVNIIQTTPRTTGWNFLIGDSRIPTARVLETDCKNCIVYGPMDPKENSETLHYPLEDAVRRTNHPANKDMLLDLALAYGPKIGLHVKDWEELKAMLPFFKLQDTYQRYDYLGKEIQKEEGAIDVQRALQILANGPVYCKITLHAWVFDPKKQTAYIAHASNNPPGTALDRSFTKIDLSPWFK